MTNEVRELKSLFVVAKLVGKPGKVDRVIVLKKKLSSSAPYMGFLICSRFANPLELKWARYSLQKEASWPMSGEVTPE